MPPPLFNVKPLASGFPVTPVIPPKVNTGDVISSAHENQVVQALSDLWTDLQALSPAIVGSVPTSRQIIAGTGLSGGGDLSQDRTLTLALTPALISAASGVVTTGSYADPAWITSLSAAKLTGSPPPAVIAAAQTPWLQDVSAATHNLTNLNSINSGGTKLGLGNAAPAYPLDVTGDVNTTTMYRVGGVQIAAANVVNAVSTAGAYANPAWITSLDAAKLTGTPPAAVISGIQTPWKQNIAGAGFTLTNASRIVIGSATDDGATPLQVVNASSTQGGTAVQALYYGGAAASYGGQFRGYGARGTQASPTATNAGDWLAALIAYGYDGSAFTQCGSIHINADATFGPSAHATSMDLFVTNTAGAQLEAMHISSTAYVAVNHATPLAPLHVKNGGTADSTGQPAGTFAAIIANATNASGQNGLFVKNNWAANGSAVLEVGNDAVGGAYKSYFHVDSGGNCGVGIASPTSILHIAAPTPQVQVVATTTTSQAVISCANGTSNGNAIFGLESSAGGTMALGSTPYAAVINNGFGKVEIGATNTILFTVASSGVGVFTTNPLSPFHTRVGTNANAGIRAGGQYNQNAIQCFAANDAYSAYNAMEVCAAPLLINSTPGGGSVFVFNDGTSTPVASDSYDVIIGPNTSAMPTLTLMNNQTTINGFVGQLSFANFAITAGSDRRIGNITVSLDASINSGRMALYAWAGAGSVCRGITISGANGCVFIQAGAGTTGDSNPGISVAGQWYTYATNNTSLVFRMRGTDGVWRQATLTLA